jgi:hypothetical protein
MSPLPKICLAKVRYTDRQLIIFNFHDRNLIEQVSIAVNLLQTRMLRHSVLTRVVIPAVLIELRGFPQSRNIWDSAFKLATNAFAQILDHTPI